MCLCLFVLYKNWETTSSLTFPLFEDTLASFSAPLMKDVEKAQIKQQPPALFLEDQRSSRRVVPFSVVHNDPYFRKRSMANNHFNPPLELLPRGSDDHQAFAATDPPPPYSAIYAKTTDTNSNCTIGNASASALFSFQIHPVCNIMHEHFNVKDNSISLLSDYGTWRSAWLVEEQAQQSHPVISRSVLKVLQYPRHEYRPYTYSMNERDSIVMDQLTGIHSTVNEFVFCGQSVVTEYARRDGLFVRQRIARHKIPPSRRLQIARDLAQGLHQIHNRSIAHGDIKLVNAVFVNGRPKWNDFNFAVFLNRRPCDGIDGPASATPAVSNNGIWRCPEELPEGAMILQYDKCDIYMFGNFLFELLTGQEPWHYDTLFENDEAKIRQAKLQGAQPFIPEGIIDEHDGDSVSKATMSLLRNAMNWCFQFHPNDRPTALQLVDFLSLA